MTGRLHSINVSRGGVPKLPIGEAEVTPLGVVGDAQRDLALHGGPERAVCLWSLDVITALRAEGHPVDVGTTGENLTIAELPWALVRPGVRLAVGDQVVLQITDYTTPCRTIWRSFRFRRYGRISQKKHPGESRVYARVLQEGVLRTGALVRLLT